MKQRILSAFLAVSIGIVCLPRVSVLASSPFKKHTIPGEIKMVDFDIGEQGETYSGYKSANWEGRYNYRGAEVKMNIYNDANGAILGMNAGEWVKFTVNAPQAGEYVFYAKYATQNVETLIRLTFDNAIQLNTELPTTGSWSEQIEHEIGRATLSAGTHEMKVDMLQRGCNFQSIVVESTDTVKLDYRKQTGAYRNHVIPCIIQAEDYDLGADGCVSLDGRNDYRKYRPDDPMNIGEIVHNSEYYLSMSEGEAVVYTFDSEVGKSYNIELCASTAGNVNLYIDNYPYPVWSELKGTGTYSLQKVAGVYLSKGTHKLRIETESQLDLDYMKLSASKEPGIDPEILAEHEYPEKTEGDSDDAEEEPAPVWRELYVSPDGNDEAGGGKASPFGTIQRAAAEVEAIRNDMEGDIIVNIASGYYQVEETINLTRTSGGANGFRVIYRGNEENMPILSGGTRITGWQRVEGDDKLWVAPADGVEELRNFYVNDKPAVRARSKNLYMALDGYLDKNSKNISDGMLMSSVNFPSGFERPEELECVWDSEWCMHRYPVLDVQYNKDNTAAVIMKQPYWNNLKQKQKSPNDPGEDKAFYFENARELLDEDGEFWFDTQEKKIYYYPFAEEDLSTAECYAATKEFLVSIKGDSVDSPVEGLSLENIQFKYGAWFEVSKKGLLVNQADNLVSTEDSVMSNTKMLPGQVTAEYADRLTIKNCRFKCLGSSALLLPNAVTNSDICGNTFTDISGDAVTIGHWDHLDNMSSNLGRCSHVKFRHNVLRRIAEEYRGCPAVMMYYVNGVSCSHNDIEDVAYSGISLGWGWGRVVEGMANNTVAYNRVVDVCGPTNDSAHIYTLGPMKGSAIHDNYCTISGDYRGGIYLDEGTGYMKVYKNVIEKPLLYWFNARANVRIKNITAYDNYTDSERYDYDPNNVTVTNTTVVKDGNWPTEALAIKNSAGVGDAYQFLLEDVELPEWHRDYIHDVPDKLYVAKTNMWIQAEDFDKGGEGVGYHKLAFGTHAKDVIFYRPEGADVWLGWYQPRETWVMGDTAADEWNAYTVDVAETKNYDIEITYSNAFAVTEPDTKVSVYMDDEEIIDSALMPRTESWNDYRDINVGSAVIPEGTHTFKIEFVDNGFSFDRWRLKGEPDTESGNEPQFNEGVYEDYVPPVKEEEYIIDTGSLFADIAGHWAEDDIIYMNKAGIIKGVSETEFAPDRSISLYETVWLAMRVMKQEYSDESWHETAYALGLLNSVSETDKAISRERFAANVMKVYMARKGGYMITVGKAPFEDMAQVSQEYDSFVRGTAVQKLMLGDDLGYFHPKDELTRAEAAAVFRRLMNQAR